MAAVLFLQREPIEWLGVMYLSAVLKAHGHRCGIWVEALEEEDPSQVLERERPDIIAFSCLTHDFQWALAKAKAVRRSSDALIVFGGTHVTLNPEDGLGDPGGDAVCRGEGEDALLELANALDARGDPSAIPNLWIRRNGDVARNDIRPLIPDLDVLPLPDRELYSRYDYLKSRGNRPLHISRGCPYRCSYCHNTKKVELYAGKGKVIRTRSVEGVLEEIEDIRTRCRVSLLHFIDDGFGVHREWITELLQCLGRQPGRRLALHANMRADLVSDEICRLFRDYGADRLRIRIAVECGDETYRREVLNKTVSNKDLLRAAALFHKYGVPFTTYNMLCLPGEGLEQGLETLRLNLQLRPSHAISFVYQPYPGTLLADYAIRKGLVSPETLKQMGTESYGGCFDSRSVFKQPDVPAIENLHRVFALVVRVPLLFGIMSRAVKHAWLTPVFRIIYRASVRAATIRRRWVDKY